MFRLTGVEMTLANVNVRTEKHGDQDKLATDVKLEGQFKNDIIEEFAPGLLGVLYRKQEVSDGGAQSKMDLEPDRLTALRYPLLGMPLKYGKEYAGYAFTLHKGIDAKSAIVHRLCTVDNFRLDCKEDGIVGLSLRVIAYPETDHQIAALCQSIQQAVTISLDPPTIEEQAQMEIDAKQGKGGDGEDEE